jgi:hypothetical protein
MRRAEAGERRLLPSSDGGLAWRATKRSSGRRRLEVISTKCAVSAGFVETPPWTGHLLDVFVARDGSLPRSCARIGAGRSDARPAR